MVEAGCGTLHSHSALNANTESGKLEGAPGLTTCVCPFELTVYMTGWKAKANCV